MTSQDDTEATLTALEAAAVSVRTANHAAYHAPTTPESLYSRAGVLVELLGGLRQIAFSLGNQVERAMSDATAHQLVLDTDDGLPAGEYVYDARRLFADAAAELEDAARATSEAHSALSHLKLVEL